MDVIKAVRHNLHCLKGTNNSADIIEGSNYSCYGQGRAHGSLILGHHSYNKYDNNEFDQHDLTEFTRIYSAWRTNRLADMKADSEVDSGSESGEDPTC